MSSENPNRTEKAFVTRQAIYNDDMKVFAYELLLRNNSLNEPAFTNGDQATAQVLLDTFWRLAWSASLDRTLPL